MLDDEIPRHMPILNEWVATAARDRPLAGVTALLIQHQLGNHVPQAAALLKLGIAPGDLHWIDIPYTATPVVREAIAKLGVPTTNMRINDYRLLDKYAPFQRRRVQAFLEEMFLHPPDTLLVLDDGSYFLEAVSCERRRLPRVAIVEQTTRGLIKIEESAVLQACAREVPIVNVARSPPKATLEPPFIGLAVCDALRRHLIGVLQVGPRDHCLVLGFGAIGRQVATFAGTILGFARNRVHVFDPSSERMRLAVADGFSPWVAGEDDVRFRLVIGCSGRASFKVGDQTLLEDGAYLASATSGTVELSREEFIELADERPDDNIWIVRDGLDELAVHSDLRFHFEGREATFVNGGFPVNFDGRVNCVPAHYIQPTPTMMCAAAVQAVRTTKRDLIDLDRPFCDWLDTRFRAELGDEASLLCGP